MGRHHYLRIAKELERRIREGVYPPDKALPPRVELSREFKVVRATIDRCFEILADKDLVTAVQGSGTYVKEIRDSKRVVAFIGLREFTGELPPVFQWRYFDYKDLAAPSSRAVLHKMDALVWRWPEDEVLAHWLDEFKGGPLQIVLNRIRPGYPCIATDHYGAYLAITRERLKLYPDAQVVFLKDRVDSLPSRYREKGFIDACRETERFYDLLVMPETFAGKSRKLDEFVPHLDPQRRLLMISDSRYHTGACIFWAREQKRRWGTDIFYSDIDNDYPEYIWGVQVTSYLQDEKKMIQAAIQKLDELWAGQGDPEAHILHFPRLVPGET